MQNKLSLDFQKMLINFILISHEKLNQQMGNGCLKSQSSKKSQELAHKAPQTSQLPQTPQIPLKQIVDQQAQEKRKAKRKLAQQTIGLLSWFDKDAVQNYGSGVLLSKSIVLTLASNIYNKKFKQQNWGFDFYLKRNSKNKVCYKVQRWLYNKKFVKNCNEDKISLKNNYAVLILQENIQNPIKIKQFLTVQIPEHICLNCYKEVQIELYDFTLKKQGDIVQIPNQKNKVTQISPKEFLIRYQFQGTNIDRGSPVIADSNILGLHIYSSQSLGGIGRFITEDMFDDIRLFCKELGDNFLEKQIQKRIKEQKAVKQQRDRLIQLQQQKQRAMQQLKDRIFSLQKMEKNDAQKKIPQTLKSGPNSITNLQIIDLSSKDNKKLTSKSIEVFAQFKLVHLSELKLDNNRIEDKGLASLCKNDYPSLKAIHIEDNAVSINGLRHIIFNKWNDQVEYKLYSVYSNDNGHHLNVGQEIPFMKLLTKRKDISQNKLTMNMKQKTILNATKLFLITPLDGQDPSLIANQSKELEEQYKKASVKNASLPLVLLLLKKSVGDNIQFRKQASLKSNVSSKIIFSGSSNQRVSFEVDLRNFKGLHVQGLKENSSKLKKLEQEFLVQIQKLYGVDTTDVSLDKVQDNPLIAQASDSTYNALGKNLPSYQTMKVKFKQHFEKFQLSESEFDSTGDLQFPQASNASVQERGGFPYYQPVVGKRFGIKVKNVFEDDKWLSMDNSKGEYAVGFHGIVDPLATKKLQNIMKGREKGEMLRAGDGQTYINGDCINKNQKVGKGIYFSPYFLTSLFEYSNITLQQQHHILLQCRLKPDAIKITSRPDYWVVNKSQDVRPYGIVLFTRDQVALLKKLPNSSSSVTLHNQIYKKQFNKITWDNNYSSKFMQFMKK